MRIGQKVTVLFLDGCRAVNRPPGKFLRCYVIRRLPCGWQLYDPVRNWSWGMSDQQRSDRVIVA